jgi:hypothetical protein
VYAGGGELPKGTNDNNCRAALDLAELDFRAAAPADAATQKFDDQQPRISCSILDRQRIKRCQNLVETEVDCCILSVAATDKLGGYVKATTNPVRISV